MEHTIEESEIDMFKKRRVPCLILLISLLCCVCTIATCSIFGFPSPFGISAYFMGDLRSIDSYPTAPPRETSSIILFSDGFSDPESGWQTGSWNNGQVNYHDGKYTITVADNNIFTYLEHTFPADLSIEVDVTVAEDKFTSGMSGYFGMICRSHTQDDGYEFTFGGDSNMMFPRSAYPSIGKLGDGKATGLISSAEYGSIFLWPEQWKNQHHLRVDCIGDKLSLYVNGYLVQQVSDTNYSTGGRVGLFGGHEDAAQMLYLFDNFVIYQP